MTKNQFRNNSKIKGCRYDASAKGCHYGTRSKPLVCMYVGNIFFPRCRENNSQEDRKNGNQTHP